MRFHRTASCLIVLALVALSGCAVNRATATVDPGAKLETIKTAYVVHAKEDERNINALIVQRLTEQGIVASTGDIAPKNVDAVVTYVDRWMWDITMYMIELTIVVREPKTDFPLATGNSFHTSLTRQPPKDMVAEVIGNIFKGVKK